MGVMSMIPKMPKETYSFIIISVRTYFKMSNLHS